MLSWKRMEELPEDRINYTSNLFVYHTLLATDSASRVQSPLAGSVEHMRPKAFMSSIYGEHLPFHTHS